MAKNWPSYSPLALLKAMQEKDCPWHENYLVMFSSLWGGFSADPAVWGVPPDDHMAHRGDAVFETFKVVRGRAYCLNEHLERLCVSAEALGLAMPAEFAHIRDIIGQAYRLGGLEDFVVRLTVSRGPGSFSVSPYDSKGGSQLYLITQKLRRPAQSVYEAGVSLATAPFPAKSEYAIIKTCDYLHNVLAKKSALDKGADYVVSFDQEGFLTEGATENVVVVTRDGDMCVPSFSRILKGVTLMRVMALAAGLVERGLLKSVRNADLTEKEAKGQAAEVFLTTTSFDVLGVSLWDGLPVGQGGTGPVARELLRLVEAEINGDGPHVTSLA